MHHCVSAPRQTCQSRLRSVTRRSLQCNPLLLTSLTSCARVVAHSTRPSLAHGPPLGNVLCNVAECRLIQKSAYRGKSDKSGVEWEAFDHDGGEGRWITQACGIRYGRAACAGDGGGHARGAATDWTAHLAAGRVHQLDTHQRQSFDSNRADSRAESVGPPSKEVGRGYLSGTEAPRTTQSGQLGDNSVNFFCEGTQVRAHVALPGATFDTSTVENVARCCEKCVASDRCTHWTFRGNDCRLKSSSDSERRAPPWSRGLHDPDNTTFSGWVHAHTNRSTVTSATTAQAVMPPTVTTELPWPAVEKQPPCIQRGTLPCCAVYAAGAEPTPPVIPHVVWQTGPRTQLALVQALVERNRVMLPNDTQFHYLDYDAMDASMRNLSELLAAEGVVGSRWHLP
jgi:hypothetical protein